MKGKQKEKKGNERKWKENERKWKENERQMKGKRKASCREPELLAVSLGNGAFFFGRSIKTPFLSKFLTQKTRGYDKILGPT